eukprot:gene2199-33756_t
MSPGSTLDRPPGPSDLYTIKLDQTSPAGGDAATSTFNVSWILLGSATQAQLEEALATKFTFLDIFEVAAPDSKNPDAVCPEGFSSVNTNTNLECLKVKEGFETHAAYFETRRYAAMMGGTTEFYKGEVMTYDGKGLKELYWVVSTIRNGMEDNGSKGSSNNRYDIGGNNDVKLAYNPCGCIFKFNHKATEMSGVICGIPLEDGTCDLAGIAGPDNIEIHNNQLVICEDSSGAHPLAFVWAMDLTTKELTNMFTMPTNVTYSEAEFTSIYFYNTFISNVRYMTTVVNNWAGSAGVKGRIGYFGPWAQRDLIKFLPGKSALPDSN